MDRFLSPILPPSNQHLHSAGVLFYEGSAANGVRVTDFVTEIGNKAAFDAFVSGGGPADHVLKVWGSHSAEAHS